MLNKLRCFLSQDWLPYAILIAGAALRIAGLTASPLWYDESFTVFLSRHPETMIYNEWTDFNPPLWQIIAFPFIKLLGENEIAVRLPSLVASIAAMFLAYKIAQYLYNLMDFNFPPVRLSVAILIAFLPYQFWMAQDGRIYAIMSLLYLGGIYCLQTDRNWGLAACIGLLLYSHATGPIYAATLVLGALAYAPRDWKPISLAAIAGGISWLPWAPAILQRSSTFWLPPLTPGILMQALLDATFAGALNLSWQFAALVALIVSITAALILSIHRLWSTRKAGVTDTTTLFARHERAALALWSIGPLILLIAVSLYKNVTFYRPLSAMMLPLALWLVAELVPRKITPLNWGILYVWGLLIIAGLVSWSPTIKGGELRQAAAIINSQYQPGDVVLHATGTSYLPFSFYLDNDGFILDEELHPALLQTRIQNEFNIPRAGLEDIPHSRAWVIWSRDPLIDDQAETRMAAYTASGQLVVRVHYWQAANIEVYLVGGRK